MSFMNNYAVWATEKYLEDHPEMDWTDAADYICTHNEKEIDEKYSMSAYLKDQKEE